jgi:hypothetical protein
MRTDYDATKEAVRDTLTPYSFEQQKVANKAMKKLFGDRLSQIKGGQTEATYYILVKEDDEWELDSFKWDFFYRDFA